MILSLCTNASPSAKFVCARSNVIPKCLTASGDVFSNSAFTLERVSITSSAVW